MDKRDIVNPDCLLFLYTTQLEYGLNRQDVDIPRIFYPRYAWFDTEWWIQHPPLWYVSFERQNPSGEFSRLYPLYFIHQNFITHNQYTIELNNRLWELKRPNEYIDLGPLFFFLKSSRFWVEDIPLEECYDHLWYYSRFFPCPKFKPNFPIQEEQFCKNVLKSRLTIREDSKYVTWRDVCREMYEVGHALFDTFLHDGLSFVWIVRAVEYYSRIVYSFYVMMFLKYSGKCERQCVESVFEHSFLVLQFLVKMHAQNWIDGKGGWKCFQGAAEWLISCEKMSSPLPLQHECEMKIPRGSEIKLPPALLMPFVRRKLFYGLALRLSETDAQTGDEFIMFHTE